tara:strand:- start:797 stop:1087 length:291 start_codon:yes stop_codon:yes gene_type:complete
MFLTFINSLKIDISRQTEFLEACDWSEEELAELLQNTEKALLEIKKEDMLINNFKEFEDLFIDKMSTYASSNQIHIILKHLKNDLQSSMSTEDKGC